MKTMSVLLSTLLATAFTGERLAAQDPAPAAPGQPAAPQTEMQKWIAATDAQWQAAFKRDVADWQEAELNKAKVQYIAALEEGIKKVSAAGDLTGALALRNEQKRFADTQLFPDQDDAADPATVKQIRATIRTQIAKVNADRGTRAQALHAKYDAALAQTQVQLTKAQRLDDALLVQAKRDEIKTAWLTPEVMAAAGKTNVPATTTPHAPIATPKPLTPGKGALAGAGSGREVLGTMAVGAPKQEGLVVVTTPKGIKSTGTFRPPLEIIYVLKTNDQLRLRYAADQIIFNWETRKTELRIDGGPAHQQHRPGLGTIPVNQFITIRQVVLPDKMTIFVDGEERTTWQGDFSKVKQEIGIMAYHNSTVWVKQVLVNQIK